MFSEIIETSYRNHCRLCLEKEESMVMITTLLEAPDMSDLLKYLHIQVVEDQRFPSKVCLNCLHLLNESISLKEKSKRTLEQLTCILNEVKEEEIIEPKPALKFELHESAEELSESEPNKSEHSEDEKRKQKKKCNICDKTVLNLTQHQTTHSTELKFSCKHCSQTFRTRSQCRYHELQNHLDIKPFTCNECHKGFVYRRSLEIHKRVHSGEKPHNCDKCDRTFTTIDSLKRHIKHVHSENEETHCCFECKKFFKYKENLIAHQKSFHEAVKMPKETCKICGKQVIFLKTHLNRTHSDKQFDCTYCPKTYKRKAALAYHVSTTHENPENTANYLCFLCGKSCRTRGDLKQHMIFKHSDERNFKCEYCERTFKSSSVQRKHERIAHLNERNHMCDSCPKAFSTKEQLRNHSRVHTGEKPFVCPICNKAFGHDSVLFRHKRVHGKT